jgi:non-ribosomal peptide synthetase component F
MRGKFYEDKIFKKFLNEVRKTVLDALSHQDFPFPLLVDKLKPERIPGTTPIFQIEFGLYKIQPDEPILSMFEAGNYGKKVLWGNMEIEYYEMTQQEGQFEILLELTEGADIISGYLKYKTDLFTKETIIKISRRYRTLLESILNNPNQKISEIQMFDEIKYTPIKKIKRVSG